MEKIIYFVRHGETTDNRDGLVGGAESDSDLTQEGIQQAIETGRKLRGTRFDFAVASPLSRAQATARYVLNELDTELDIVIKPEFIEKYVGEYAGRPYTEYKAYKLAGGRSGESEEVMIERVHRGLDWLKQQEFTSALVVSHSATIANVRTIVEGLPLEDLASVPRLGNGEFYKITADQIPPLK